MEIQNKKINYNNYFLNYKSNFCSIKMFQIDISSYLPSLQSTLSALGAAISMSLTNPFNLVRFRMQTMPDLILQNQLESPYKGLTDCFKRVYLQEGFRAFWKGNGSNLIRFYPAEALTFFLKDILNLQISKYFSLSKHEGFYINTLSGIISGCITLTMLYPLQFARMKLVNDVKGQKLGINAIIWSTYKAEGLVGIYRGSLISYLGMIAFRGIFFGIYDSYKRSTQNYLQKLGISYISTVAALIGIYPFDTVRRRMMMTSGQNYKYGSYREFIKQIYKSQGLRGFFSGMPVIFIEALTIGTMFMLFDQLCSVSDASN